MTTKKNIFYSIILTIAAISQIILAIALYDPQANTNIINTGWFILMLSALFGWLPIFTLRSKGQVKGKGYTQTTVLVNSGVYGIVRHPQYLAGVLISIALPLITQHWLVVLPGIIAIGIYYLDTFEEEKKNIEKFGKDYKDYMRKVPRMNFISGILRLIRYKFLK